MYCYRLFRLALFIYTFFIFGHSLSAQEQLGMRLERYSGIYSAALNPANTAFMPHNWEINLFNADYFFENNYAFLQNTSLPNAIRNADNIIATSDLASEQPLPTNAILLDYFDKNRRMRAVSQAHIGGPGFIFRLGENHVLGLTTAVRGDFSGYRVPSIFRYPAFSKIQIGETIDIQPFGMEAMIWEEIGLHYSSSNSDGELTTAWGVNPKFLLGFAGGYGQSKGSFQYTPGRNDTAIFNKPSWEYGLSGGLLDAETVSDGGSELGGFGAGADVGFSWAAADETGGYRWRAGISLLDLGFIRFSRGSEQHLLRLDSIGAIDGNAINADNAQGYTRILSDLLMGDPLASLQAQSFSMGLPTALSVQFDVQAIPNLYVSAVVVQRVPLFKHALKRTSTLAVAPRFEHRWVSLSLPVVLNDWQSLRVGLAARLGWLYIGSDNLGSFFTQERLTGTDAYIGLKINGFSFGSGSGRKDRLTKERRSGSRQNRRKVKCYTF